MIGGTTSSGVHNEPDWSERRRRVKSAPPDVDLYLVDLADVEDWAASRTSWLTRDDLARAGELRDASRRHEFLTSLVVLRRLVALRLSCPPENVELSRDPTTGATAPARFRTRTGGDSEVRIHYSLARVLGHIAIVTADRPVGVDLERRQSPDQAESLLRVFHPADQARLSRGPARRRARAVTDAWVRLEALLKARGTGLSTDPSAVTLGAANRVRHPDGIIVTGVRPRLGSQLHAAVAWLEDPSS